MANPAIDRLRAEALDLPQTDRAELALALVASLDGPSDSDVTETWDAEIQRRLDQIDAGTAKLIDRDAFRQRMRKHIARA